MAQVTASDRAFAEILAACGSKRCSACKETLPILEFHSDKSKRHGLSSACKACTSERAKAACIARREGRPRRHTGNLSVAESERRAELARQGLKDCIGCKRRLPLDAFAAMRSSYQPQCKQCTRERVKSTGVWRRYVYGIEPSEYDRIRSAQMDRCAICVEPLQGSYGEHLDHDHETGLHRGILCGRCNRLLGTASDNPRLLLEAVIYLHRHGR